MTSLMHYALKDLDSSFNNWSIGFDRPFQILRELQRSTDSSYLPYNIRSLGKDRYTVEIAASGFSREDIKVEVKENYLVITGEKTTEEPGEYLYKGIATRDFIQRFALADDVKVVFAKMDNGILTVTLEQEIPDHKKPQVIEIE